MTPLLALALSATLIQAQPNQQLLRACETEVKAKFKEWRLAPVSADVAKAAESNKENPTIVSGDFNGDDRKDLALLIQLGPFAEPDNRLRIEIAVCMNTASSTKLYVIDQPYCGDGIALSRKGGQYYDFETEQEGAYKFDGVHAYCFEKAGATFEFDNGTFRKIVDSD